MTSISDAPVGRSVWGFVLRSLSEVSAAMIDPCGNDVQCPPVVARKSVLIGFRGVGCVGSRLQNATA